MGRQKVARDGSEWSLFTHVKEEMGGGEALAVLEGKHPLGVHTLRTRRCPVSAAVVSRRPEDRRRARSGSPAFLLALLSFLPCSRTLQPSAARSRRPAGTQPAEPSLVRGHCGGPCVLEDWERGEEGGFWRPRLSQGY